MRSRRKLTEEERAGFKRERRINRRSTVVSFFAIAAFLAVGFLFIKNAPTPLSAMNEADKNRKVPRLSLAAHYYAGEGMPLEDVSGPAQSAAMVFTVSSIRPVHLSIAASLDGAEPVVLFHRVRIPPGPKRLVEKAGTPFVFTLEETVRSARFCVIGGSDSEKLQQGINHLKADWAAFDEDVCVILR